MQKTRKRGGTGSAKIELADGVKVKKEKSAEQEVKFERQDKAKTELDDFWLRVKAEIKKELEQDEQEHAWKSSGLDDLTPKDIMMKEEMEEEPKYDETFESLHSQSDHSEVATQEREIEKSNKAANSRTAVEPEPKPELANPEESSLDAFASHAATWAKQCLVFRSSKTWSPTRPCCPANVFLGSANGTPSPPPTDAPACVLRLTGHGLRCLQRFHEKHGLHSMPNFCTVPAWYEDYKVRGLDCIKMWPWMRDLPTSVGLAAEEVKPSDEKITEEAPAAIAAAQNPLPPSEEQKPSRFLRNNVAKQSGIPNVKWNTRDCAWEVNFPKVDPKGRWTVKNRSKTTNRSFSVKKFIGPGISEAQGDAAALNAAKAFHAELVEKGLLSEPKPKDPNFTSEVPGVKWDKNRQKWQVQISRKGGKKRISGGYFTEKAAAEAKALRLQEKDGLQRQVKPVATLSELPVCHPKVPYPGVTWEQRSQQWRARCDVGGSTRNFYMRPMDHSEAELERSFQVAVAWKKKQEKEKEKEKERKAVKSKAKPGKKQRKTITFNAGHAYGEFPDCFLLLCVHACEEGGGNFLMDGYEILRQLEEDPQMRPAPARDVRGESPGGGARVAAARQRGIVKEICSWGLGMAMGFL
eukprot:s4743_g5.t1